MKTVGSNISFVDTIPLCKIHMFLACHTFRRKMDKRRILVEQLRLCNLPNDDDLFFGWKTMNSIVRSRHGRKNVLHSEANTSCAETKANNFYFLVICLWKTTQWLLRASLLLKEVSNTDFATCDCYTLFCCQVERNYHCFFKPTVHTGL